MPIPKPTQGEKKEDFISRCMSDDKMKQEYGKESQRYAVCSTSWKDSRKGSK